MVIGASIIIYTIAIGYICIKSRNTALDQAISLTDILAEKYAADIKFLLEEDLITVRTLSRTALTYRTLPQQQWKELYAKMYEKVITEESQFLSIWDSWELSNLDPTYSKSFGRYVCEFWREGGTIRHKTSLKDLTGDAFEYGRIKRDNVECLENPYFYSYSENEKDQQQMTSLIVPINENGNFIGVVGVDISLNRYHPIINQIKPFKGSYAFLIANDLHYVAHPSIDKTGENVTDDYESLFTKHGVVDKIVNGEPVSFIDNDLTGIKSYFSFKPIIVGNTVRPWSLVIIVPKVTILEEASRNFVISIIVGILGLIFLAIVFFFSTKTFIFSPIHNITLMLNRLSNGHIGNDMMLEYNQSDKVGQMAYALNSSIKGLLQKTNFAQKIGQGDLEAELELLGDEDLLGKSLVYMQKSLKTAQEEEKTRKAEDEKRQWTNAGLAKFSDILRQNNDQLDALAAEIIKNLVQYINANQGGVFIYNDDEPENVHFELLSAYAYNHYKFIKKQILPGEGLVGTCALEKQTIYLTEIPENYIQITSGLGEARPRCLLIVPLLIEEKVLGILELASFTEIEQYQIDFIEKLAQSIASTLTSVRTNIRTSILLSKTQQQAEEMSAQEEEMRQNMEELQATQEEAARKTSEMQSYIDAINNSSFLIEYDTNGYITSLNDAYINLFNIPREKLIGTHHSYKMEFTDEQQKEYEKFWNDLRVGAVKKITNKFIIDNTTYIFDETYTPLMDEQGLVYKIIKIAHNVSR